MSATEFKDKGNKHLQAGEYDLAIEAYTKAIELNPNDHVFYSNRSAAYLSKGDALAALNDADQVIHINPTWAKGYSRKGAALHALKKWDDAILAYESGLAIAPTDSGLQLGLSDVQKTKQLSQLRSNPANNGSGSGFLAPQFLAKLAGHPKFGPKLADPAFLQKLQLMQTNPQLLMSDPELMEILQVMLGSPGGSGVGGDDEEEDEHHNFSSQNSYNHQPKQSSSSFQSESQSKKPTQTSSVDPFANLSEEEKAEKQIKMNAIAAKDRGNTLYKEKKFDEAIAAYDEAISIDPTNITFLNNKAAVYIEMGNIDKALELCNEALELSKIHRTSYEDKAKVYQRIAAAHLKRNDLAAAINAYEKSQMEVFDKAIERKVKNLQLDLRKLEQESYVNPELATEAKERGNAAFRDGKFPEAIKEYEEAVKRHPTNPSYRNNLAAAYLKMGLFNDAKREIEKCLEIDKTYVKAWAKKGDIEFFMKEYHKALESYQTGLNLEADNSLCKDGIRKTLEKINSSQGPDSERQAHAMADPEIQMILQDPVMRNILRDMQENPQSAQAALRDPIISAKLNKLIAAGILQVG